MVYDTRDLSRLSKVLGSDKAQSALRAGGSLDEAEIYVDTREESIARLSKVTKELEVLLKKVLPARSRQKARILKLYYAFNEAVKAFVDSPSE